MSRDSDPRPAVPPAALGPLEMAVLDVLWVSGPQSVAAMHEKVGAPRSLSRNTIHSTLERLVRKQLASRRKLVRAYEYRATVSKSDWIAGALSALLDFVPGSDPAELLAGFVDVAERAGSKSLDDLERIVRARRRAVQTRRRHPEGES